jgi:hypothetical protein
MPDEDGYPTQEDLDALRQFNGTIEEYRTGTNTTRTEKGPCQCASTRSVPLAGAAMSCLSGQGSISACL